MSSLSLHPASTQSSQQSQAFIHRFFRVILWVLFAVSLLLAPWHGTWHAALAIGLPIALGTTFLILRAPDALLTKMAVGAAFMIFCGLHIHQANGMIEVHFGIFALLALLVVYEDWRIIVWAALVIAIHHVGASYLQYKGFAVICMPMPSVACVLIHAGYVVVESAGLCYIALVMHKKSLATERESQTAQESLHSLQRVAGQTRIGVDAIQTASQALSASSSSIAEGARVQTSSLEHAVSNLTRMTATLRQTADHARQAHQLAGESRDSAQQGQQVVTNAVAAMQEINLASARIADIISTIDEIAFQTNLLAVNAAVEAARAGEQGRGFAVVATEVRSLAQRSANAAKEIKTLIQDSLKKVERGTGLVNRSGDTLQVIVRSAERVTDIVAEIAAATQQQTAGIDQLSSAVSQIDSVTQSNNHQTAELASTAESLAIQSRRLITLVSVFDQVESQDSPASHAPHSSHNAQSGPSEAPRVAPTKPRKTRAKSTVLRMEMNSRDGILQPSNPPVSSDGEDIFDAPIPGDA